MKQPFERRPGSNVPHAFLGLLYAAELESSAAPGVFRRDPLRDQIGGMRVDMKSQLLVELAIEAHSSDQPGKPAHRGQSAVLSTSAIALVNRSQSERSRSSCFCPAFVRL